MRIINWLRSIKRAMTGEAWAERTITEYMEAFPGRCPICGYHRFGLQEGMTKELLPNPHAMCPEGKRYPGLPHCENDIPSTT